MKRSFIINTEISKNKDSAELSETIQTETEQIAEVLLKTIPDEEVQCGHAFDELKADKIAAALSSIITEIGESTLKVVSEYNAQIAKTASAVLTKIVESPFLNWVNNLDFSPVYKALEALVSLGELQDLYNKLNAAYLQAMYDCHWFPYVGNSVTYELYLEVTDILKSSRGTSKRREKRIDKAILNYYGRDEILTIKKQWKKSNLEPHIIRILTQALNAHLRGEYALTIACLSTMWEGLIHTKTFVVGRRNSEKTKKDFKQLISKNEYELIFADFYENFIVSQCNTPEEVIEGIPNRNGVSHSKYKKYPNKKASLNAILLTDFIISLQPKNLTM